MIYDVRFMIYDLRFSHTVQILGGNQQVTRNYL